MPAYRITIEDGRPPERLTVDLPDIRVARNEATRLAGEMLREGPDGFWDSAGWTVRVEDDNGRVLFSLDIGGSVAPCGERR